MAIADITAHRVRELLHYDAETGVFTWRERPALTVSRAKAGDAAGHKMRIGYIAISIDYCHVYAHRLAWLHVHGAWPTAQIDHIDGDRANNRIANLRQATNAQNTRNSKTARRNGSSGFLGVTRNHKRWMAQIKTDGVYRYLGTFDTAEQAHAAYLDAKRLAHDFCTI